MKRILITETHSSEFEKRKEEEIKCRWGEYNLIDEKRL